uniref:Transporter n=1 Tax=Panagrolaimus sp. PS1159 TaxID=55785 RepID=A0AC35F4A8_9BILA
MEAYRSSVVEPHSNDSKLRVGFNIHDVGEDGNIHRHGKRKTHFGIEIIDRGGHWRAPQDFIFSMIAYAVGLGNIWRFPYLCYKNGGGTFLIAYIACFAIIALPIFVLEVAIGQYLQTGALRIWKVCPLFRGVGFGNIILSLMCASYFCVIVSWALFYLVSSFNLTFPWETCDNFWNTGNCFTGEENATTITNLTKHFSSIETSVEQFWQHRVIQQTSEITEFGGIQWELFVLMLFSWLVVYFAIWNGTSETRRFLYFSSLFPYFIIFILFIRGITLPGAFSGVSYFLTPNFTTLTKDINIWSDAGSQVLYSYGIGYGTLIALGSHNKFNHNCYRDAFFMCFVNVATSIFTGLIVFSVLGYMALIGGKEIAEIVKPTAGLIFVVFPELIRHLPLKQIWCFAVFLVIVILGLDTQVCILENLFTSFEDKFPFLLKKHRKVSRLFGCILFFFMGIPLISFNGIYWLTLVDSYGASGVSLMFVVFFEVIGISWGFGTDNVRFGIYEMIGIQIPRLWKILWNITAPFSIAILFIITIIRYNPLKYTNNNPALPYWAEYIGFGLALSSMIPIPIYALYFIIFKNRRHSLKTRLQKGITPPSDSTTTKTEVHEERVKFLERPSFKYPTSMANGKPKAIDRRGLSV